ncbi:transmembrane protein, putative (macronuclear) [Tetrahymena thermophila SB210]|uniref:Transmembrane protein, putative n=1 Tax=Tetrahymena thermophila (strain SB210) TaxID=312017 RepID=W7X688_TETTS|nr:transmembrane protein, putative [Tetrahymena thermophila SB210]EWS71848.1 transmembrane protein, putative [Tetrahymena thermophila SB210]|eukprot:XP_012655592.1 transmembrane protein, putative [Tetrahymena thermophila SB210]
MARMRKGEVDKMYFQNNFLIEKNKENTYNIQTKLQINSQGNKEKFTSYCYYYFYYKCIKYNQNCQNQNLFEIDNNYYCYLISVRFLQLIYYQNKQISILYFFIVKKARKKCCYSYSSILLFFYKYCNFLYFKFLFLFLSQFFSLFKLYIYYFQITMYLQIHFLIHMIYFILIASKKELNQLIYLLTYLFIVSQIYFFFKIHQ